MEWKHQKRLTWVALVLFTGFIAACGSSDSDSVAPTQAYSQVTGDVTYTGLKTQAALTAENADTMAAGALGFDIFGTTPEAKAISGSADLLAGKNSESLSLAELLDSLPKSSAADTKSIKRGYGGYGGFSLYETVDLQLEEPEELLKTVLNKERGFPNLSEDASFTQTTTMVLAEADKKATFTTTLTFTDCIHCDDWDFAGNDPALCDELVSLNSDSAQVTTVIDLTGITESDLAELETMVTDHPEIALIRLIDQDNYRGHTAIYSGDYYPGFNFWSSSGDNSYNFPYTCSLAYSGTVARKEKSERDDASAANTLNGTFASTFETVMDFPLDSDINSGTTYDGYAAVTRVSEIYNHGYGGGYTYTSGYGYGGYSTKRTSTFTGSMELKSEGGPGMMPRFKDSSPVASNLTMSLTIPEGTIEKSYTRKLFSNSYNYEDRGEDKTSERNDGLTNISISGATSLDLSWEQSGIAGTLAFAASKGAIKETRSNNRYSLIETASPDTATDKGINNSISYEFSGNATLSGSLTADLLSPVSQSLTMECQNGSVLYSSANGTRQHDYAEDASSASTLNTRVETGGLTELGLSGRVTLESGDNYFLYNGALSYTEKGYLTKRNLINHAPTDPYDAYDETNITATDITIQTNGLDLCVEGTYLSRDGGWWNSDDTEYLQNIDTTDLDLVMVNNLTSTSRWFNNYKLITTEKVMTPGIGYPQEFFDHESTTLTGRFYNSDLGYVDVATKDGAPLLTFNLDNYPGYVFPTYGEIVVTGASGTTASLVPLATEINTDEVKRLPVPDGFKVIFGETATEYKWPDMEAMLSQNWFYRLANLGLVFINGPRS